MVMQPMEQPKQNHWWGKMPVGRLTFKQNTTWVASHEKAGQVKKKKREWWDCCHVWLNITRAHYQQLYVLRLAPLSWTLDFSLLPVARGPCNSSSKLGHDWVKGSIVNNYARATGCKRVNKLDYWVTILMSTLSSGRGIIWAFKGGRGLWEKVCSRVFL